MANTKHTVIRTDLMHGTDQPADLLSVRVYASVGGAAKEVDNGFIAEIPGSLVSDEREIFAAIPPKATTTLNKAAIIAGVEVMYDERLKNLYEYTNEAKKTTRAYRLHNGDIFSITAEGFTDTTLPAAGDTVGVNTDGKLKKSGKLGTCIEVQDIGGTKYYAIRVTADDDGTIEPNS